MTKDKNESPTKDDPWYGKFETELGVEVSGTAALLSRLKALGGMNAVIQKAVTTGAMAAASQIANNLSAGAIRGKKK